MLRYVTCALSFVIVACAQGMAYEPERADDDGAGERADAAVTVTTLDASISVHDASRIVLDADEAEPDLMPSAIDASEPSMPDARMPEPPDASSLDAFVPDANAPDPIDPGKGDGRDVVTLGDSWMSNTLQLLGTGGGIAPSLRDRAGQRYPNYAVQGVMLLARSAFGPAIPTQWDDATRANPMIKTVIMTAGGNDIIQDDALQADCARGGDACKAKLEEIARALKALWDRMAAAGVQDIVHVLYASTAGDGLADPEANRATLRALCAAVAPPTRCHLIATEQLVGGSLALDDLHPTRSANDRMAAAIYQRMVDERMRR